jgi:hypothetical protein
VQSLGSLTDLDLSFSYTSRTGAEVREERRERLKCQHDYEGKRVQQFDMLLPCAPFLFLSRQVLRNVLNRPDCQLVRLSIAGNAIGDSGAEVLRSGLEVRYWVLRRL